MPPLNYDGWRRLVKEVEAEEAEQGGEDAAEKEWSEMTPEERQAAIEQAEQQEREVTASRREHDEYLQNITRDVEMADESWMYDVDQDSYEDFTIKRTWRIVKKRGADFFKAGEYSKAEQQWMGGLLLIQKVGMSWPTALELYTQLKCNLAQLYLKQERWIEARQMATAVIEADPKCEKALYRRALVRMHYADWAEARRDLERLLAAHPHNQDASKRLLEVKQALRSAETKFKGAGVRLSSAMEELTPDGTLRKLQVLVAGQEQPADTRWTWPWGLAEWLGPSREKAVLTVHVVVRSVGGEELFSTRTRLQLPETPEERELMRARMQEVAELDDKAGKVARKPADFCRKNPLHPMRWRYGDPSVYAGFELAARSMMLGERALFEIDQPLLEPSVCDFYQKDGGAARVAGLPNFKHHIEERKLHLLAEELPEWELDLENKTQRTVRAELELLSIELFRDLSPARSGDYLLCIGSPGRADGRRLQRGATVLGDFVIAGALDGLALYHVQRAVWKLGGEGAESYVYKPGQRTVWIPKCLGQILSDANWAVLHEGAHLEARLQAGPSPMELNPTYARDLNWKRAFGHRPPVAITLDIHSILDC